MTNLDPLSPRVKYYQAQLHLLNDMENQHDLAPNRTALLLAGGLSTIEALVAFFLLINAGWLIASIGALFPVFLLWAMANYHAEKVELPKKYDNLGEKYHDAV